MDMIRYECNPDISISVLNDEISKNNRHPITGEFPWHGTHLMYSGASLGEYKYEALSYTWKGEIASEPILVDGMRLLIPPNLHDLLLSRRQCYEAKDRFVW